MDLGDSLNLLFRREWGEGQGGGGGMMKIHFNRFCLKEKEVCLCSGGVCNSEEIPE